MNLIDKIALVGQRMKSEQISERVIIGLFEGFGIG